MNFRAKMGKIVQGSKCMSNLFPSPPASVAKKTLSLSFFQLGTILTMHASCKMKRLDVSVTLVCQGEKKSISQTSMYNLSLLFFEVLMLP